VLLVAFSVHVASLHLLVQLQLLLDVASLLVSAHDLLIDRDLHFPFDQLRVVVFLQRFLVWVHFPLQDFDVDVWRDSLACVRVRYHVLQILHSVRNVRSLAGRFHDQVLAMSRS
jgi:hypothetical protein